MISPLTGPFIIPKSSTILGAVFLLHGFGSDGQDLISLAPYIDASLPAKTQQHMAYFSPNAPQPTPFMMGYQWFSDKDWTFKDKPGIDTASQNIHQYIEEEAINKLGLNWNQIFILGFSQGGMTALHAVSQWPEELGGLIGHSTKLMWPETLPENGLKTPVLLLHGTADDVLPADSMITTQKALEATGTQVQSHLLPGLAHGLNEESIQHIATFIEARMAK